MLKHQNIFYKFNSQSMYTPELLGNKSQKKDLVWTQQAFSST